jgi:F-type H+-transporting ATPase subunit b
MEEIVHAFGIDGRLIVVQMVNFGILAFALWYFLYTPVLNVLKSREEKIKAGIRDAELAEEAHKNAARESARRLTDAETEARSLVISAEKRAGEKAEELLHEAQLRVETVIEDARREALEVKARALKESEAEVAKAAILAAEGILRK